MKTALVFCLCLGVSPGLTAQSPVPRDTPPPVIENARRERDLRAAIAGGTATVETYLQLSTLLQKMGRFDDSIDVLRGGAALQPGLAEPHHRIGMLLWSRSREPQLDAATRLRYARQGVEAEDRALAIEPDYVEALTSKNVLLRVQANLTADPVEQKRLLDEADLLRNRTIALQKARQSAGGARVAGAPAPFIGFPEPFEQSLARLQPVLRVGGNIRTPVKVKDVKPVYPAEAQAARVQGVVIIEALVGVDGSVENARVLRSIEMLDEAALTAVSEWKFTPTEVNGAPASVLMTVTVNFTIQQ